MGLANGEIEPRMLYDGRPLGGADREKRAFCHVRTGDQWEFDKDDNTRKFTEMKHNAQVDETQFKMPESK